MNPMEVVKEVVVSVLSNPDHDEASLDDNKANEDRKLCDDMCMEVVEAAVAVDLGLSLILCDSVEVNTLVLGCIDPCEDGTPVGPDNTADLEEKY
jgi:hypothetical protein